VKLDVEYMGTLCTVFTTFVFEDLDSIGEY